MSEAPVLNEEYILGMLHPTTQVTPEGLRGCARYLVLACYDRKILREPFDEILSGACEMSSLATHMELIGIVTKTFRDTDTETPHFDERIAEMQQQMVAMRLNLCDKFVKVMECPTEKLKIN